MDKINKIRNNCARILFFSLFINYSISMSITEVQVIDENVQKQLNQELVNVLNRCRLEEQRDQEELDLELFYNRHNYDYEPSVFKDEDLNEALRLINEGANINTQSDCGINTLMIAVKKGNKTIVESLLNNKKHLIDLNLQDNHGYTALISAAVIGNKEIVKLLLACPNVTSPIDLNLKTIKTKETALMKATARGYIGVIELLSTCSNDKAAIDLHIKNQDEYDTFLRLASLANHEEIQNLLNNMLKEEEQQNALKLANITNNDETQSALDGRFDVQDEQSSLGSSTTSNEEIVQNLPSDTLEEEKQNVLKLAGITNNEEVQSLEEHNNYTLLKISGTCVATYLAYKLLNKITTGKAKNKTELEDKNIYDVSLSID